jgi:hypothetical protein
LLGLYLEPWTKKKCVPHEGRGQLFIAKAPEEIRMGKPEKRKHGILDPTKEETDDL